MAVFTAVGVEKIGSATGAGGYLVDGFLLQAGLAKKMGNGPGQVQPPWLVLTSHQGRGEAGKRTGYLLTDLETAGPDCRAQDCLGGWE